MINIKALNIALEHEITVLKTFEERIGLVAEYAKKYTQAERCSIFVYKQEEDQLQSIYGDGIESLRINSNAGLAGYAFHKRKTVIENNTSASTYFFKAVDQQSGYKTKVVLATPIISSEGKRLGVVQLLNKPNGFSEQDKIYIESITEFLVVLIDPTIPVADKDDFLLLLIDPNAEPASKKSSQPTSVVSKRKSVTLQEKFDTYLADKKLFLMEDENAYYMILGMKRAYFIGADKCYHLDESPKEISLSYYATDGEFLSQRAYVKIDRHANGVLIKESDFETQFSHYPLEADGL